MRTYLGCCCDAFIQIYGDKDADGFYRGEANGRIGFVPCNMVSEVQYDGTDPTMITDPTMMARRQGGADPWAHLPVRKMIALYDYDPQELSPNVESEVSSIILRAPKGCLHVVALIVAYCWLMIV